MSAVHRLWEGLMDLNDDIFNSNIYLDEHPEIRKNLQSIIDQISKTVSMKEEFLNPEILLEFIRKESLKRKPKKK